MRIILVGGGTSGHINPALNIAEYIREMDKNAEILYVGSRSGTEENLAKKSNLNFHGITVSGFSRKISFEALSKNFHTIRNTVISSFESKQILKDFKPDICVGTGGYVMGAFLYQASLCNIPFVIQEQNAIPGFTTKILAKHARAVLLGSDDAKKYFNGANCIVTGNPVKNNFANISKEEAKNKLGISNNLPTILSFGGSLGAPAINNVILDLMKMNKYNHIHGYGRNNKKFEDNIKIMKNHNIREYIYNMDECMVACDVVICRAGAMTLSELAILGKPAILIPSPHVANNHQFYNALSYSKKFTASVVNEKDLDSEKLSIEIDRLLKFRQENRVEKSLSCEKIYKVLTSIVRH